MDTSKMRRQRAPKTTADQYEVFLDFANRNPAIIENRRDPLDSDQLVQMKWEELTIVLNTSGRGPQRTTKEWQNTFSNWKNSIRHKMKCISDGTSRTPLNELETRALQLWDIAGFLGMPRYSRKRDSSAAAAAALLMDDSGAGHDESTHSSSAFYGGGGGGVGHIKDEPQQHHNGDVQPHRRKRRHEQLLDQSDYDNGGDAYNNGSVNPLQLDNGDNDGGDNDGGDDEEDDDDRGGGGGDDDADDGGGKNEEEFDEDNSLPPTLPMKLPNAITITATGAAPVKKRKYVFKHTLQQGGATSLLRHQRQQQQHHHQQIQLQQQQHHMSFTSRRNGSGGGSALAHAGERPPGQADELDGSILIAESIAKLADNVGHMAESIRDIAAAFTTTTQAAFELIRRQSEIIQTLIEK